MITVIAEIKTRPGQRATVLQAIDKLIPLVLAEDGCSGYLPLVDVATELPWQHTAPDSIFMLEYWESVSHLEKHLAVEHMKKHAAAVKDMVDGVSIHVLDKAL
ncbi:MULTISPECIES: putative quinol monooxygenase [Silvimonas]|uniref:putative quinol monooxygenase n=1 Tax=Silvimonas TaxID=300264 RepID=UPI0024B3C52C|nr:MULTISPECIES: putative quinol monooxygenase [Silvimonas]MDR3426167.1 putative quinol monooxygenase [Silvimonas sp.]